METFIPSTPSPAGLAAPSCGLGCASASPDTAGSAAGIFQLLMNRCLAQAGGNGQPTGAPAADPAPEDTTGEAASGEEEVDGGEGMASAGLFLAASPVAAPPALPASEEAVSPYLSTAVASADPPESSSADAPKAEGGGMEPAAAEGMAEAVPSEAAKAAPAVPSGASVAKDVPAAAVPFSAADLPPVGETARTAPPAAVVPKDMSAAEAAFPAADLPAAGETGAAPPAAVVAKDVPAAKPRVPSGEAQGDPGRDRFLSAAEAAPEAEPSASPAPTDGNPSPGAGEGEFARGDAASEWMRAESASRAEEPANPTAHQAVAAGRNAPEGPSGVRPAAAEPAAQAQKAFQAGENAFVLHRKSDTSVEITLSPPGVGKLEIEVILDKGVINANITAADSVGREAIERSLPQILQTLSSEGMAIGGFTVSLKQGKDPDGKTPAGMASRGGPEGSAASAAVRSAAAPTGLVDIFV